MVIKIIIIGTIVVIALFAVVYYLGYREDKKQRDYLKTQIKLFFVSENRDLHPSAQIGARFSCTKRRGRTRISHRPEGVKARNGEDERANLVRNSSG
jgi:hypothetical protein